MTATRFTTTAFVLALATFANVTGDSATAQRRAPPAPSRTTDSSNIVTKPMLRAIEDGLAYLSQRQDPEGFWGQDVGYKLNSDYRVTSRQVPHVGVTALALMSFLAGGHMPGRGKYGDVVERGLDYMLNQVSENGYITDHGTRMYSHALATLFLAEVYGMTRRDDVRNGLQDSVNIIVDSQNAEGGWRYKPFARESDMSITVCQVVALRSARNVGITVPARTIKDAETYVLKSAVSHGGAAGRSGRNLRRTMYTVNEGGAFRYQLQAHSRTTFPLTAAGITTLHAAGRYDHPVLSEAFEFLDQRMGGFNANYAGHYFFYYGHYYAVQAYYTAGGSRWNNYFVDMRDLLVRMQESDGSWPCSVGPGPEFATAVSTLILQIPLQFLPIFQR